MSPHIFYNFICEYSTHWCQHDHHKIGPPISWGPIPKKSLLGLLLLANTHHALKFCIDPFRGIDEIGSKKIATFAF